VEEGEIGLPFLVPVNEDPPKAIHPTMRTFHYPPPRPSARVAFERLGFFSPGPDVGGEAKLLERLPHLRVIVSLVQPPPLGPLLRGGVAA
jgi:hypothetical protein